VTKRRLKAAVAALLLGSQLGSPAAAEAPIEHLLQISNYIEAGNLEALVLFLMEHPELMEGDTPLAVLLRRFMAEAQDLWAYLAIDPPLRSAVARELRDAGGGSSSPIVRIPTSPVPEVPTSPPGEVPTDAVPEAPLDPVAEAPLDPVAEVPIEEDPAIY
jgi:hypothetical protein